MTTPASRLSTEVLRARLAALAGAVSLSLVAIVFARSGDLAQHLFLRLYHAHPWMAAGMTPLTFVAVAWTTRRWFPEARGSGIPQVMAAGHNPAHSGNGPLISLRTAAAKYVGTIAMLLVGGSVGREGPTVQISAAVVAAVHRWLRVPDQGGLPCAETALCGETPKVMISTPLR